MNLSQYMYSVMCIVSALSGVWWLFIFSVSSAFRAQLRRSVTWPATISTNSCRRRPAAPGLSRLKWEFPLRFPSSISGSMRCWLKAWSIVKAWKPVYKYICTKKCSVSMRFWTSWAEPNNRYSFLRDTKSMLFFSKCCHGLSRNNLKVNDLGLPRIVTLGGSCALKAIAPINIDGWA